LEFSQLPNFAKMPNGELKTLEGTDNYHVATMRVRESCLLATTDMRLRAAYEKEVI
jgi:predicted nucleic acid-binding protein